MIKMNKKLLGTFGFELYPTKIWDLGWAIAYQTKGKKLHIRPYKNEHDMKYILYNYCGIKEEI